MRATFSAIAIFFFVLAAGEVAEVRVEAPPLACEIETCSG